MRYVVALSLVCVAFGSACSVKPAHQRTREQMISSVSAMLKYWDKDGDGKLSRAEVVAMNDYSFRRIATVVPGGKMTPYLEERRQEALSAYANQDSDHDGYLTLDELLKGPLASFDCIDANHDGKLSDDELSKRMGPCSTVNHRVPKP